MITFCLMTCGEATEKDCLKSIKSFQDITLIEVRNVTPQILALNSMLKQTTTEYLVPLDADLILNDNAYARILSAIDANKDNKDWHSIIFSLYDTFTESKILALKVLRMSIIKNFPFAESATPDIEHSARLREAGYSIISYADQEPIGTHNVVGTKFCYNKYKDVYRTLKVYKNGWDSGVFMGGETILDKSKNHFDFFEYKWIMTGNKDYLWAIAGMVDGLTTEPENKSKSFDELKINADAAIEAYINWFNNQRKLML